MGIDGVSKVANEQRREKSERVREIKRGQNVKDIDLMSDTSSA